MSHSENRQNVSAPATNEAANLESVIRAIVAAVGPGVVKSALVATGLLDPQLSGIVLDPDEPGGGYVTEYELAQGATYIVLGVGKGVGEPEPGISAVSLQEAPHVTTG